MLRSKTCNGKNRTIHIGDNDVPRKFQSNVAVLKGEPTRACSRVSEDTGLQGTVNGIFQTDVTCNQIIRYGLEGIGSAMCPISGAICFPKSVVNSRFKIKSDIHRYLNR